MNANPLVVRLRGGALRLLDLQLLFLVLLVRRVAVLRALRCRELVSDALALLAFHPVAAAETMQSNHRLTAFDLGPLGHHYFRRFPLVSAIELEQALAQPYQGLLELPLLLRLVLPRLDRLARLILGALLLDRIQERLRLSESNVTTACFFSSGVDQVETMYFVPREVQLP